MNVLAYGLLIAYPLLVVAAFVLTTPSKAIFFSYFFAWLYLPLLTLDIPGLPNYGKFTAANLVMLPCIALFALPRLQWRFHVTDLAVLGWVLCPIPSSLTNNLGLYNGLAGSTEHFLTYGVPYVAGKTAIQGWPDWASFLTMYRWFAWSYIPLCLYEMRMSPVLHRQIFGIGGRRSGDLNTMFGPLAWQPTVFMNSVFEVAMMFVVIGIFSLGLSLVKTEEGGQLRTQKRLFLLFAALVLLCKKWSQLGLLLIGSLVLRSRNRLVFFAFLAVPFAYQLVFVSGMYRGEGLVDFLGNFSARRSETLNVRLQNDSRLVNKALERAVFGWGGWGRNRVYNEQGKDISLTDSLWTLTLGKYGVIGLAFQTLLFWIPAMYVAPRLKSDSRRMNSSRVVILAGSVVLGLHLYDNLFNAFPNSIFPMLAGALVISPSESTALKSI